MSITNDSDRIDLGVVRLVTTKHGSRYALTDDVIVRAHGFDLKVAMLQTAVARTVLTGRVRASVFTAAGHFVTWSSSPITKVAFVRVERFVSTGRVQLTVEGARPVAVLSTYERNLVRLALAACNVFATTTPTPVAVTS